MSPENETSDIQVETPNQGNKTLLRVHADGREKLVENSLGSQLTKPSQVSNEIQVWTQILEQKNKD